MKLSIFFSNERFAPHIRYVFEHIAEYAGIKDLSFFSYEDLKSDVEGDVTITYGDMPPFFHSLHIHIQEASLFSDIYLDPSSLPSPPLARWNDLPVLYGENPDGNPWVEKDRYRIICRMDLVAGIFFLLSRYEEIIIRDRDEYGRFPAKSALALKEKYLERPLADEYAELLLSWIRELYPSFEAKNPFNSHPFSLYITHDVDAPFKYTWRNVLGLRQPFLRGLAVLMGKIPDPWWTFPELQRIDRENGIRADYFFLSGGNHPLDRGYTLEDPRMLDLIGMLRENDSGIGIHFSLESHLSLKKDLESPKSGKAFIREHTHFVEKTRNFPLGSRQHFLAVSVPETWRQLEKMDIEFDASVGFAEAPGFRCGTCRPFRCFDAKNGKMLQVREIPLVAMDATFIHYLKSTPREALEQLKRLVTVVERYRGVFCLLWHNNTLCEEDYPGWRECYIDFLKFCQQRNPLTECPFDRTAQQEL
jgi:hypothetical protein